MPNCSQIAGFTRSVSLPHFRPPTGTSRPPRACGRRRRARGRCGRCRAPAGSAWGRRAASYSFLLSDSGTTSSRSPAITMTGADSEPIRSIDGIAVDEQPARPAATGSAPADFGQRRERGAQHQRGRRPLHRQADGDRGAEGLAEVDDPVGVDLGLRGQPCLRGPRVGGKAVLRRSAGVAAVSAVVEQQHRHAQPGQPGGQHAPAPTGLPRCR